MPKGTCVKCGAEYYGWALQRVEEQHCPLCKSPLKIEEEEKKEEIKCLKLEIG